MPFPVVSFEQQICKYICGRISCDVYQKLFFLLCDSIKISRQSSLFINCSKLNKIRVVARMILVQHKQVAAPINIHILVKPKNKYNNAAKAHSSYKRWKICKIYIIISCQGEPCQRKYQCKEVTNVICLENFHLGT